VLDPEHRAEALEESSCPFGRLWYEGWDVRRPPRAACRLQHLMLWDHAKERDAALRAACPALTELDSVREAAYR
jgi:hypothetical protein